MHEAPTPPLPRPPAPRRALAAAVGAATVVALAAVGAWWAGRQPPAGPEGAGPAPVNDPRLTYPTRYRNVRPGVKYVGDTACAGCHVKEAESYARHPMGRSLAPVAEAAPLERYDRSGLNPFTAQGLEYGVRRDGARAFHREGAAGGPAIEEEAHFAIGSGTRARSYLFSRDEYLFQSPLTYFTQAGRWDLSPSYEIRNQHFTRVVTPGCLFCHCNYADHVEGTSNRYRPPTFRGHAIGCERCHGPGELHVQSRRAGQAPDGVDDTIVNPSRLDVPLRDAVCEQCHLQGEQRVVARGRSEFDFRPGLPLHLFLMDFVDARSRRGDHKFVSAVEQMRVSRCYAESRAPKKLGCASCHDPHWAPGPGEKVAHYRAACLKCHAERGCSVPLAARGKQQPDDSCYACHMPHISSEVNHTSSTDHRVPRRAARPGREKAPRRPTPGPDDLTPYHGELLASGDEEVSRNHGVALVAMLERGLPPPLQRAFAEKALPLLDRAVGRDEGDVAALDARADALWLLGRVEEARAGYEAALGKRPDEEGTLHGAANLALATNRVADARRYYERAAKISPYNSRFHHGLAVTSFRRGEWAQGARECRQALKLEPTRAATRSLLVQCLLGLGDRAGAKAEYETIRRLTPVGQHYDLREWYEEQVRRLGR